MNSIPSSVELSGADLVTEPPEPPAVVRTVDFHELSRSMQERFVACTSGAVAPRPLFVAPPQSFVVALSIASILVGCGALVVIIGFGFGRLDGAGTPRVLGGSIALHGTKTLPIYGLSIALVVLGVTQLLRRYAERRALPFVRAQYVFPLTLIDARDALLRVVSLADVISAECAPRAPCDVRLVLVNGQVVTIRTRHERDALAALQAIEARRTEARALGAADARTTLMFTLDPLQRPRISSPLGLRSDLAGRLPRWTTHVWMLAPIAGVLLAPPIRAARNLASDRALFTFANARGDADSLRAYIAIGGRLSELVRTTLLPRAELREAEKEGTVEAIDRYRTLHPGQIPDEVAASRREAMLDELAIAKKPGTVPALQEFARKRPDHDLEPELRAAMHALFAPALTAYRNKPMRSPEVRSFVERLFAWSEAKAHAGSAATTIQIRWRKRPTSSMRKADKMVSEHHWFIGEASYPSRYFDTAHAQKREKLYGDALAKRVRDAFGPTVFTVETGARLDDAQTDALPAVSEPTLFITHAENWKGLFDGSITKPRGVWVAITHHFEAVFVIPGDDKRLIFDLETRDWIPHEVIKDNPAGGTPTAPLEEKIYGAMADEAFSMFGERFNATVLPPTTL